MGEVNVHQLIELKGYMFVWIKRDELSVHSHLDVTGILKEEERWKEGVHSDLRGAVRFYSFLLSSWQARSGLARLC